MRNLFLALVLANLGFAAWHAWWGAPRGAPANRQEQAGITLVKELDAQGEGNSATAEILGTTATAETAATATAETAGLGDAPTAGAAGAGPGAVAPEAARAARASENAPPAARGKAAPGPRTAASKAAAPASAKGGAASGTAAASSTAPAKSAPVAADARCVSVGPFLDLAQATTASAKLRASGYKPSQRAGEGDVWVGYWVYLDAIPSREEANRMLSLLHDNGVGDAYAIQGDDGRRISLGVFTEIARAGRLRDQVRALGLEPKVVDRTRREDVFWIDLELGTGQQVDFEALQTPGRITRLEQRPCPPPGGA